ncbi:hypothetical protein [Aquifex sp.]
MEGRLKTYEEKVRFLTEVLKLCWITIVGLTGGLVGLLVKPTKSDLILLAALLGVLVDVGLILTGLKILLRINQLLAEMDKLSKEEEKE